MRLLLDTHALLWWLAGGDELSAAAFEAIAASSSIVHVSAVSAWEMSIKRAKGRLESPTDLVDAMAANGFAELAINVAHAELAGALPPHHADPFDRLLIAQARIEGLTIVTRDPAFEVYGIPLLVA